MKWTYAHRSPGNSNLAPDNSWLGSYSFFFKLTSFDKISKKIRNVQESIDNISEKNDLEISKNKTFSQKIFKNLKKFLKIL